MVNVDKFIKDNSGLVYAQLWKFNLADDPDAESIAFEALYNAIVTYDISSGTKLSTYATVIIYNALGSYIRTCNSKRKVQTISYNKVTHVDDSGNEHELAEMIQASGSVEDDYIHKSVCKAAMSLFDEYLCKVTNEKHIQILTIWKESEFTATTVTIASRVGTSQSYVSQVINNFKSKLKKKLEVMYYD